MRHAALWPDIRHAGRSMARSPGFAAAAVLTLALGIGASTALFSVIENVLMEPFPYADAQRLVSVMIHDTEQAQPGGRAAYVGPEYLDYVAQSRVFDRVIASSNDDVLYATGEGTERLEGLLVTPGTFEFFGMPALLGRAMLPSDYEPSAAPVFVMRHKTWVNRFNADPGVLGRSFVLDGVARTLVGVMPPRFAWGDAELWIPARPATALDASAGAFPRYWYLLGHLKPGVSLREAEVDLEVVARRLAQVYPKDYPKHFTVQVQALAEQVVGQFRATLLVVLGAVGLLLLIGCANVGNLLLARGTAREKELAIRSALGASRWRLVRALLTESLLLALAGAGLGCFLAWAGLKGLVAAVPPRTIPAEAVIRLNGTVLLFTLATAFGTALVFGLLPALQSVRRDLSEPLRDSGKGTAGGLRRSRLRDGVVVLEVALSLTLLVGAGLLMRSFVALREVDLGFAPDHVLVARLPLPPERYKTARELAGFYRPLLQRLSALPGVVAATETSTLPPYGGIRSEIDVPGRSSVEKRTALFQLCSEEYFATLRIRFVAGRSFSESEVEGARKLAVVNQTFALKYLGGANPLASSVRLAELATFPDAVADPTFEIVGVVADVKNQGLQDPVQPEVWVPYTLTGAGERGILVRTAQEPLALLERVRREIWATDRNVALTLTGTLEGFISEFSYAGPRFGFLVMSLFACVGLVLVTTGVYSVLSYAAARQTHEIGIRMAIGAEREHVLKMVLGFGGRLVGLGVVLGVVASVGLARLISSQLWGVSASDPATLLGVVCVILATGFLACWVPARRATQVDPVIALRHE